MFGKNGGTARIPVYIALEIQNNGSVTIFTCARTTSRLGPSTGKTLVRLKLLFWVHRPFFIRAVPKEDLNVNGASTAEIVHVFTKFPRTSKGCQTKIRCSQRSILRFDHPPGDPLRGYPCYELNPQHCRCQLPRSQVPSQFCQMFPFLTQLEMMELLNLQSSCIQPAPTSVLTPISNRSGRIVRRLAYLRDFTT